MSLPFDVSRCACWWACPQRDKCARFVDKGSPEQQAMTDFSLHLGGKPCEMFIQVEGEG